MSPTRRRRVEKILDARKRAVDLAEAKLAALARRVQEAENASGEARSTWRARLDCCGPRECSSSDLDREHGYVETLGRRATVLAAAAREAKALEESARRDVCNAKMEHKKVETWLDRLVEASGQEELRLERLRSDEVASRIARKT
jgi:hypothetical protein